MAKPKKSLLDQVNVQPKAQSSKNPTIALDRNDSRAVDSYVPVAQRFKEIEAEKSLAYGAVKDVGQAAYAERAAKGGFENPRLVGEEHSVLYIVQDSFNAVSAEKKIMLEQAGLSEYIERDQIQLVSGLDEKMQERILKALAAEFGQKEALALVATQYKVRDGALKDYARKNPIKEKILAAMKLLDPRQQVRL